MTRLSEHSKPGQKLVPSPASHNDQVFERGGITILGNYKGDLAAICKTLNEVLLYDENFEVEVRGDELYCDPDAIYLPRRDPFVDILRFSDGREVFADIASKTTLHEWEKDDGSYSFDVSRLEILCEKIPPLLTEGKIDFIAKINSPAKDLILFHRLEIRSDGSARHTSSWVGRGFYMDTETTRRRVGR